MSSCSARVALLLAVLGLAGAGPVTGTAPPAPDPALDRAVAAWHHGEPAAARAAIDSLLAARPDHFGAHVVLGHLLLEAGDRGGARRTFQRAVELEPRRPEGHNGLGLADLDEVRSNLRAILTLRKLVFSDPEKRAVRHFERALELEPGFHDAALNLADLYIHKGSAESYERAAAILQDRMASGYRLDDMLCRLGLAFLGLERYGEAENTFLQITARTPNHDLANYRLAQILVATGRPREATEAYVRATRALADPELEEELEAQVSPVLTREESRQMAAAPDVGAFLRRYWKRQDPTPTTVENERLVEHERRVLAARRNYGSAEPRGFDDRGAILIRFGEPNEKHIAAASELAKPNESWAYSGLGSAVITFDFVDEGGGIFHLTTDLEKALSSFSLAASGRVEALLEIYRERESLSPDYGKVAGELILMREGGAGSLEQELQQVRSVLAEAERAAERRQADAPQSRFVAPAGNDELAGQIALARFRGGEGKGRLEIYYGVPVEALKFAAGGAAGAPRASVIEESFAVFDDQFEEVAAASRQKSIRVTDPSAAGQAYVGEVNIPLDPASYQVAFTLRDLNASRSRTFRFRLRMPDYGADSLRLSDLQLGREVERGGAGPELRPYPFPGVDRRRPLYVHYAIYGLDRATDGLTDFRVAYELERPPGAIVRLFGRLNPFSGAGGQATAVALDAARRSTGRDADEMVELDLKTLEPGEYVLSIRVEDRIGGAEADAQTRIVVMD